MFVSTGNVFRVTVRIVRVGVYTSFINRRTNPKVLIVLLIEIDISLLLPNCIKIYQTILLARGCTKGFAVLGLKLFRRRGNIHPINPDFPHHPPPLMLLSGRKQHDFFEPFTKVFWTPLGYIPVNGNTHKVEPTHSS